AEGFLSAMAPLLETIVNPNRNLIAAFSTEARLDVCKNLMRDLGLTREVVNEGTVADTLTRKADLVTGESAQKTLKENISNICKEFSENKITKEEMLTKLANEMDGKVSDRTGLTETISKAVDKSMELGVVVKTLQASGDHVETLHRVAIFGSGTSAQEGASMAENSGGRYRIFLGVNEQIGRGIDIK